MTGTEQKTLLVFISHASEDNAAAKRLAKRLKDDGFDPWLDLDRLLPGQDWNLEIEKAMRASGAILLCFSEESVAKESYIQKEYKRAMRIQEEKPEGTIFVIPLRLDKCELPFFIREIQWVDYPEGYEKLIVALQVRAGGTLTKEKPETKKELASKKPAAPKRTGGNIFNIQGDIHVGRDLIGGDQINIHRETTLNISTPADFVSELQKLKAEIEALKSQPGIEPTVTRRLNAVEGDIEEVITEAEQETPVMERINSTLSSAKETMEKLGGSITTALSLGTTLGNLALIAIKVFGG
jgi:hypothetical protein